MNINLERLIRKKDRRFKKAKKSGMDEDRARYLNIEQMVKREIRDAKRVYVNVILHNGIESGNNKPFWKYMKSPKQETFGISALKCKDNVITDSLSKAEIINSQFKYLSLHILEIHFPSCGVLNAPKLNLYIFLKIVFFMLLDRIVKVIWTRQASWKITAVSS